MLRQPAHLYDIRLGVSLQLKSGLAVQAEPHHGCVCVPMDVSKNHLKDQWFGDCWFFVINLCSVFQTPVSKQLFDTLKFWSNTLFFDKVLLNWF